MSNYKHILVAINLSNEAEQVVDYAKAISQQYAEASLTILHVLHHTHHKTSKFVSVFSTQETREVRLKEVARQRLINLVNRFGTKPVEALIGIGRSWQVILQAAQEYKTELIILGSHTPHGLVDILGSIPDRVLHHAPCEVLVVQTDPNKYTQGKIANYKHILVATDFSKESEKIAQQGAHWAQYYGAGLTLLHVVEHFPVDESNEWIAPEDQDPAEYREKIAREALATLTARIGQENAKQEIVLSIKAAKHEIAHFAKQHDVDLIVLGSHGVAGVQTLLGSTVDGVLHQASCDVLVIRVEN